MITSSKKALFFLMLFIVGCSTTRVDEEINKALWNINRKGEELINVTIHPTRKTIMLFIKSPH